MQSESHTKYNAMQLYWKLIHGTIITTLKSLDTLISEDFSSVQSLSRILLFVTPWTAALQAYLSITNSQSLLKLMSIESVMPSSISSSVIPFSSCLQSFPASRSFRMSQFFFIRWPKYWSFSFSISPSNEYSGLISFRMDWLDLLAAQGTLKSLQKIYSRLNSTDWHSLNIYYMPGSVPTVLQLTSVDSHCCLLSEMRGQSCVTGGQKWQHMWVKQ